MPKLNFGGLIGLLGVAVADVNSDGWMDIYIAVAMKDENRNNRLYIHQGFRL